MALMLRGFQSRDGATVAHCINELGSRMPGLARPGYCSLVM